MKAPMRIAVTGSTGLIGSNLVASLQADGHTVHRMVRDRAEVQGDAIHWNIEERVVDTAALEGVDAVVHLAGAPIGERWTDEQKRAIHDSREDGTKLLAEALASLDERPSVLVSGSAVGWYGSRGDEVLDESSTAGDDFLAQVCIAWEDATAAAEAAGIRVVHARTGVIIHEDGPLIDKIELPFKAGVGGRVGDGHQFVPWISLDDDIAALRFLIDHDDISGPVNLTGPNPVTNRAMTKTIGAVMHRPTLFPVPVFAIRALYGEMGVTLATTSQRAVPKVLQAAGFSFEDQSIDAALEKALRSE